MLTLALPALLTFASAQPCAPQVQDRFDNLQRSLRDVERSLDDIGSRATRVRIRHQLDTLRRRANEARQEACRQSAPVATPPPVIVVPPHPHEPLDVEQNPPQRFLAPILSSADHRALMAAIKGESFKENRLDVLRAGMDGMCLTSSQAKEIVQLFSFADSKSTALQTMIPRIVDRQKSYQIFSVLTFSSTKKKLKRLLKNTPQHESCAP